MKALFSLMLLVLSITSYSQLISEYPNYLHKSYTEINREITKTIPESKINLNVKDGLNIITHNVDNQTYFKRSFAFRTNDQDHCIAVVLYYNLDIINVIISNMNAFYSKESEYKWKDNKTNVYYSIDKSNDYFVLQIFK